MCRGVIHRWTLLLYFRLFHEWTTDSAKRPPSGSLLQLETKDEQTNVVPA